MARRDDEREKIARLRVGLIQWYERNRRELPWRGGQDSYAIWVSEIMLQQTRVAVVIDRYQAFMSRFPSLLSLALAREQDVLAMWSGLGYYRRARMLHKAAQFVANHQDGTLPVTAEELLKLPGIGVYTAAAIASIAHGEPVAVVDGNVERVLCRFAGWESGSRTGAAALRRKIEELASRLVDPERAGDFNQAMMELGATVCLPRNPQCVACPIAADCKTRGEHKTMPRPRMLSREIAYALSVRTAGKSRKARGSVSRSSAGTATSRANGDAGVMELPTLRDSHVPQKDLRMNVRHAIMQVNYYVRIRTVFEDDADAMCVPGGERRWIPLGEAAGMALTGLTRKVLSRAHLLPTAALDAIDPRQGTDVI